jgi:hypothetical protein
VDHIFAGNCTPKARFGACFKYWLASTKLSKSRRHIAHCHDAKAPIAIVKEQQSEVGVAKSGRIRQHSLKYWGEVARRTGDNTQYFGRCCLLLKGFSQFVQQSRVLDSDDGLIGKVPQ